MLIASILLLSLANIALGFYITRLFRRDAFRCMLYEAQAGPHRTEEDAPSASADAPASDDAAKQTEPQTEQRDIQAEQPRDKSRQAAEMPPTGPLENLFELAARFTEHLAELDDRTVSDESTEQLAPLWNQLDEWTAPLQAAFDPVCELNASDEQRDCLLALVSSGETLIERSNKLVNDEQQREKPADQAAELYELRELFTAACNFRDECEDVIANTLEEEPELYGNRSQLTFRRKVEQLMESEAADYCGVGIELEEIRELNSLYGAATVDLLLHELHHRLEENLPACELVARLHGQYYLAVIAGTLAEVTSMTDDLTQHMANNPLEIKGRPIEIVLRAKAVPISAAIETLLTPKIALPSGDSTLAAAGV